MKVESLFFLFLNAFCIYINKDVKLLVYCSIIAMTANKLFHRLKKNIFMRDPGVVVCGRQESSNSNHTEPLTNVCSQIT